MHRAGGGSQNTAVSARGRPPEDLPVIGACVLGKETRTVDAHALCVGAPNELARQAVPQWSAVDVRIDRHPLPRPEASHITTDLDDLTDRFVSRCWRINPRCTSRGADADQCHTPDW